MFNVFELGPTHFFRGGEKFSRVVLPPLVTGLTMAGGQQKQLTKSKISTFI